MLLEKVGRLPFAHFIKAQTPLALKKIKNKNKKKKYKEGSSLLPSTNGELILLHQI